MSLKNLLDLRKKVNPQIQIVEKIILQKRSWKTEVLRTFAVIITASAVIWGISNADVLTPSKEAPKNQQQIVGIYGTISNVASSTFTLTKEIKPTELTNSIYTVTTTNIKKIETKDYASFSLSDLTEGDTVIVQGKDLGDTIDALHIIFFSHATTTPETATSTATTTDATTTDSTSTASTTGTTSPSLIDTIKDVVSNAINTITGTTSTSTDDTTSTATSTDEATTSIQVATNIEATTSTSSNPSIIQTVTDAVTNTVNNVVSAITGTTSSVGTPTTPPTPDPLPAPAPAPSDTPAPAVTPTN